MSNLAKIYELPQNCIPEKVDVLFRGTKVTFHFENEIENPLVFRRVEEILLDACELKWTEGAKCGIM